MEICSSPSHSQVVIAYDAAKQCSKWELYNSVGTILKRGGILLRGNTLVVLVVMHLVPHPFGYRAKACPGLFEINDCEVEKVVSKKADLYVVNLLKSAEMCEEYGVNIEVKIIAGSLIKQVILQEVMACNAAWLILDRQLKRDLKFYLKHIPCSTVLLRDQYTVEVLKPFTGSSGTDHVIQHDYHFSISKSVPSDSQARDDIEFLFYTYGSFPLGLHSLEVERSDTLNSSSQNAVEASNPLISYRDDGETPTCVLTCSLSSIIIQTSISRTPQADKLRTP